MSTVLVVAVHPDDETLGCGGTILRHKALGHEVHWLIVTAMHEAQGYDESRRKKRQREIADVADLYGFASVTNLGFPTARLDTLPFSDLIGAVADTVHRVRPETLYAPFHADAHSDHRLAFHAVMSCAKSFRAPFLKRLLMMETLSETESTPPLPHHAFTPNVFVDITPYFSTKLQAMRTYESELRPPPFPRSAKTMEALARYRGAAAFCEYAEAFMLLREIV